MNKGNILISSNIFPSSASSLEIGNYVAKGISNITNKYNIFNVPMCDGSKGTAEILKYNARGNLIREEILDSVGNTRTSSYCIIKKDIAIIEANDLFEKTAL